jgi:hypothetical protein
VLIIYKVSFILRALLKTLTIFALRDFVYIEATRRVIAKATAMRGNEDRHKIYKARREGNFLTILSSDFLLLATARSFKIFLKLV